eukprot:1149962-Pelagomonas_calceolata.AAC.6
MAMRQAAAKLLSRSLSRGATEQHQQGGLALRFARGFASDPASSGSADTGYVSQVYLRRDDDDNDAGEAACTISSEDREFN